MSRTNRPRPTHTVVQSLPALLDSYKAAPFDRCDETGKPDPNGAYVRSHDGKISLLLFTHPFAKEPTT
jgi:hypothetical protein